MEPPKNTPNHKEYKEIEMVLKETVEILEEMKEEIVGIEGLEFILKGFRDGYERRGWWDIWIFKINVGLNELYDYKMDKDVK